MNAFYEHHKSSIEFGYRCFDRILLNGLIQPFQQPERVLGFFNTYRDGKRVTTKHDSSDAFGKRGAQYVGYAGWGCIVIDALDLFCPQPEPFMGIIAAYFDESGKQHDHPVVTFCGVCAPLSKIRHFQHDWEGLLRHYKLEEFHMAEAANPTKSLSAKLPSQSLSERVQALKPWADCINEHLELGLIQAWDVQGFNSLSKRAKKGLGDPNDPYYTAFARGLLHLAGHVQGDDQISLICDDDAETAINCYAHYRAIRNVHEDIRKKAVSLAFADSGAFPAIQAADMAAWLTRRQARFEFFGDAFPMRELFEYL